MFVWEWGMKAICLRARDGPEALAYDEAQQPRPGEGEVLVRVHAAGEYCVARIADIAHKPTSVDHVHAAATPISALTTWQGLVDRAGLAAGQRVLIHGAAGGVGTFAVQLARWRGARVTATASAANLDFVRSLGADEVIDYRAERFEDVV